MKLKPTHIVILSFLAAILIGTLLLKLPFAVNEGNSISFTDSLFTATSATCVTGLIVKDTGTFFSDFGKLVIFILFQMGGLGIMTFSMLFAIAMGRKLTIKENVVIRRALNQQKIENVTSLLKYIVTITIGVEFIGALLLFLRWSHTESWGLKTTIIRSIFHSVSGFCNAGFSVFNTNFTEFMSDPFINAIMIALIFIGGIGFIVILDIPRILFFKKKLIKINVQTKLALTVSLILIILGAIMFFALESYGTLEGLSFKDKLLASFFQSVTARTAGFNTINIGSLLSPTLFVLIFLMFVGASPGSTGGGIKTCTFGVIFASVIAMFRNKDKASLFKTSIPKEVVRKAIVIFFLAAAWIFVGAILLSFIEEGRLGYVNNYFMRILFEVTSAFGTVGLSTGITPQLSNLGKILISITMLVGRIGPLTAAIAVSLQRGQAIYAYPEENIMVG